MTRPVHDRLVRGEWMAASDGIRNIKPGAARAPSEPNA